ncbi:hypothetical protein ACPB9J_05885 [Streptomyces lavendulocolor]|uniref:hypothetical protein n=1 Tax=Streptomyces lavendulocolor TaxID=67316 RepID=UPI003C3014B2
MDTKNGKDHHVTNLGSMLDGLIPLPPVGVDIPCSMYGANTPLKINILGRLTLDFKGGFTAAVRTSSTDGVVVEVQGFRVEADTSPSTPGSGTLIALSKSDAPTVPLSVLQAVSSGGLEMLLHLPLTVEVIDKATGETHARLVTAPAKHATLRAVDVQAFPPVNQLYTLLEPVQLYPADDSAAAGTELAGVLEGADFIVNQSV